MTEEVTAPEGVEEAAEVNLSLGDISAMVSIIDICSKRGAFEGSELETVGTLRSRIAAFVAQANPPEEEVDADPEGREQPEAEA